MKKLTTLLLFLLGGLLFAETIDIAKSEGTDQSIIISLTPAPASPEVDANVTIEVVFNEALNPISTRHSIVLKCLSTKKKTWGMFGFGISRNKDKNIKGSVTYNRNKNSLRFRPDQPLEVGFYEVAFRHLMKMKPGIGIKPIVYRFYVPEVINGFKLPPKPNQKKNDSTLLGIDFNHNGIRDDVERWIIKHYAQDPKYPKTKTAIALQYAKASQYIISHDPEHAYENKTYEIFDRAMDCEGYWLNTITKDMNSSAYIDFSLENNIFGDNFKSKMFNTKERTKAYWQFNGSLSGHMLGGGGGIMSSTKDKCDTDIDTLGEIR